MNKRKEKLRKGIVLQAVGSRQRWTGLTLCVLVIPLMLTSCSWKIGPNYTEPVAPIAEEWCSTEDSNIVSAPTDPKEWWKAFNDPVLNALIEEACGQNLSLQAAGLRIIEARTARSLQAWSLAPYVGVTSSFSHINLSQNVDPSLNVITKRGFEAQDLKAVFQGSQDIYNTGFDSLWEPDIWGDKRRGIESASASYEAMVAQYDDILISLIGEIAATYVNYRMSEKRIEALLENIEIQTENLEDIQQFRKGSTLEIAMLTTLLGSTKSQALFLRNARSESLTALCVLLGRPPQNLNRLLGKSETIPSVPKQIAVGVPADLLRRRPDIRRAERAAAAQSARIGMVKSAALLPQFHLAGSLGWSTSYSRDYINPTSQMGFYNLGTRWNIIAYPALVNNIRFEDARFEELSCQYQETVLRAAQEVENAANAFVLAQEQAVILEKTSEVAMEAVTISILKNTDKTDLVSEGFLSIKYLADLSDRAIVARSAVAINAIALYKAMGGGWEVRDGKAYVSDEMQKQMRERTDWKTFGGKKQLSTEATHSPE